MKPIAHTARLQQALARIAAGETTYAVGKALGISLSYLYRVQKATRQAPASGQTTPA